MSPWLQTLRHDLIKRATWPARDVQVLLGAGEAVEARDVRALRAGLFGLRAGDGRMVRASALLEELRADVPAGVSGAALDELQKLLEVAEARMVAVPSDEALARDAQRLSDMVSLILSIGEIFDRLAGGGS